MDIPKTKESLISRIFQQYDKNFIGELTAEQMQQIHNNIRIGGISLPQVCASIEYSCIGPTVEESEIFDLLQEMDRRYYLVQDFRWEFSMLDTENSDTISEEQAKWFVQSVHGKWFSKKKWEKFLRHRAVPKSGVRFSEIEVILCNIPSKEDYLLEQGEDERERQERARKEAEFQRLLEEERIRRKSMKDVAIQKAREQEEMDEEERRKRRLQDEKERQQRLREKEEEKNRQKKLDEEEERGRREAEIRAKKANKEDEEVEKENQRLEKLKRLREEQEKQWKKDLQDADECEKIYETAKAGEENANREADNARDRAKRTADDNERREAEEREQRARLNAKENRNKKIRYNLKVAVKRRDRERLPPAVDEFKKAKLPDDDMDLAKAERLLREFQARDGLQKAMSQRELKALEKAIAYVKRSGFEMELAHELLEANRILLQLRRLERIRAEILELKQSTVAEIRSYQKPPEIVHVVMTGTFLILGHKEKETKVWKTVQSLVGKTGKEGLKRRCLECNPDNIKDEDAKRAKKLMSSFDLDDVRDVSAGAATFYVWSMTMIEEKQIRIEAKKREAEEKLKEQKEREEKEEAIKKQRAEAAKTPIDTQKSLDNSETNPTKTDESNETGN
ncbi:DgyrCDS6485 [Dimorphilus gyrociliatus]|uniref:DgyrCDS6485 n=1 Tax=Dimorphilus gyrociliatus TaxID=2664684 RepID=A0A7I8VN76_9ANNE|nr:DgyrCDS6485 [Dimorphilus gyrociliatus]